MRPEGCKVKVLITCERGREREVLEELAGLGMFEPSGFRDVILGEVDNLEEFLQAVEMKPFLPIMRVVPLEETFYFSPENFLEVVKERASKHVDRIQKGQTFAVRMERRGMKGVLSSREVEREVGGYIWQLLHERWGERPKVNLTDPDWLIAIETVGNFGGISFIPRDLRQRYRLIRVK